MHFAPLPLSPSSPSYPRTSKPLYRVPLFLPPPVIFIYTRIHIFCTHSRCLRATIPFPYTASPSPLIPFSSLSCIRVIFQWQIYVTLRCVVCFACRYIAANQFAFFPLLFSSIIVAKPFRRFFCLAVLLLRMFNNIQCSISSGLIVTNYLGRLFKFEE